MPAAIDDPDHNLYQRGTTWWVRYKVHGETRRESLGTDNVKKARRLRDQKLEAAADVRAGRVPVVERTWEEAVEAYIDWQDGQVKAGAMSPTTAEGYETGIGHITAFLETNRALSEITAGTAMEFVKARRDEGRAANTIKNGLTAWSRVMSYAVVNAWVPANPLLTFERGTYVGTDADTIDPPTDAEAAALIAEIREEWSPIVADLFEWLRETGMRLGEALAVEAPDIHPDGQTATLSRGVKRNKRDGAKTRTIYLGRAALILPRLAAKGRLFGALPKTSTEISSRYGHWLKRRQAAENRAAKAQGRPPVTLRTFRIHDLRHAFAIASLIDDPTRVYPLKLHLGHASIQTTEGYVRFMDREGGRRRHSRDPSLFGSLPAGSPGEAWRAAPGGTTRPVAQKVAHVPGKPIVAAPDGDGNWLEFLGILDAG